MIVAAGLLVLVGLGLFVAGVLTGGTNLYWACVGACVVAAVLLFLARRRMGGTDAPAAGRAPAAPPAQTSTGRHAGGTARTAAASAPAATGTPATAAAPATAAGASTPAADPAPRADDAGEPPVEEVEVTDLLLVVDLRDEVLVVDEHPRYHVAGCPRLTGQETIPIPLDEARTDGFTPCGTCRPDGTLADRVRARKHSSSG